MLVEACPRQGICENVDGQRIHRLVALGVAGGIAKSDYGFWRNMEKKLPEKLDLFKVMFYFKKPIVNHRLNLFSGSTMSNLWISVDFHHPNVVFVHRLTSWNQQFAPENQWLEDESSLWDALFSGAMLVQGV